VLTEAGARALSPGVRTPAARLPRVRREAVLLGLAGLTIALGAWEAAARLSLVDPVVLASPARVGAALGRQWSRGELTRDLAWSGAAFALGFGLAAVVGIGLGLAMGAWRGVELALDPFVWFLYATPLVALHPLLVTWVGFGLPVAVTLAFLLAVIPITVNTVGAVHAADPVLVRAVRAFGGSRRALATKVVLPGSLPLILAGLRLAAGRALVGVVVGEMFGANAGLGFRMTLYGARLRTAEALAPVLLLALLGVAVTQGLRLLESRLGRWREP
jgi:ABC-type nitrate/sulfonate/bicarbonate transport system permease component